MNTTSTAPASTSTQEQTIRPSDRTMFFQMALGQRFSFDPSSHYNPEAAKNSELCTLVWIKTSDQGFKIEGKHSEDYCETPYHAMLPTYVLLFAPILEKPATPETLIEKSTKEKNDAYQVKVGNKTFVVIPSETAAHVTVYAAIKTSSKYEWQGRLVPHESKSARVLFPVDEVYAGKDYAIRLMFASGGSYRREDLDFYLCSGKEFTKI